MPPEQALDYKALKTALLKRFDLTEDGFKRKFRASRPEGAETFSQFSVRLSSYLQRWIDMSKTSKTFDDLFDLVIRDQFLHVCSKDLSLFLRERTPSSITEMADLADQFREARLTTACNLTAKATHSHSSQSGCDISKTKTFEITKVDSPKSSDKKPFVPKSERRCFKCDKIGHIASECRPKIKGRVNAVISDIQESNTDDGENAESNSRHVCSALFTPSDCLKASKAVLPDSSSTLVSSCIINNSSVMPVCTGFVDGTKVNVLRDTGCTGIVVRQSKIDQTNFTGSYETCTLADGSKLKVSVALVTIDTPYLSGTYTACCMEAPVYDLIIGNVDQVRAPEHPDPEWKPSQDFQTRLCSPQNDKLISNHAIGNVAIHEDMHVTKQNESLLSKCIDSVSKHARSLSNIVSVRWLITMLVALVLFTQLTSHVPVGSKVQFVSCTSAFILSDPVENVWLSDVQEHSVNFHSLHNVCTRTKFDQNNSCYFMASHCYYLARAKLKPFTYTFRIKLAYAYSMAKRDLNTVFCQVAFTDSAKRLTKFHKPKCRLQFPVNHFVLSVCKGQRAGHVGLSSARYKTLPVQTATRSGIQIFQSCLYGSEFCTETVHHPLIYRDKKGVSVCQTLPVAVDIIKR